jgi:hypothetical protein
MINGYIGKRVLINTNPNSSMIVMEYTIKEISPSGEYVNLTNAGIISNWYKVDAIKVVEILD